MSELVEKIKDKVQKLFKLSQSLGDTAHKAGHLEMRNFYDAQKSAYEDLLEFINKLPSEWHKADKEQPPVDEEVIALVSRYGDEPRMICFAHIVDKEICVDYNGWNIPNVEFWMYNPSLPTKDDD